MKVQLVIEYDGTNFSGWQYQPEKLTIQGELEHAIQSLLQFESVKFRKDPPSEIQLTVSGRTDAGVHAYNQIATFEWPDQIELDQEKFQYSLNSKISNDIVVRTVLKVDNDFHPRHKPHYKTYRYKMLLGRHRGGLQKNRIWLIPPDVNITEMILAARCFVGIHDFASFRGKGCGASSTVRTIRLSQLSRVSSNELHYLIQGKGFLKQMVRILVGTLVDIGTGKLKRADIPAIFEAKSRQEAGQTAPPYGLYLEDIRYQKSIVEPE